MTTWKDGESVEYSYVPDYLEEASECEQRITTSEGYQDQVRFLEVGATYIYSIRAFAKVSVLDYVCVSCSLLYFLCTLTCMIETIQEYMVNPEGSMLRNSKPLSLRHTVAWVSIPLHF